MRFGRVCVRARVRVCVRVCVCDGSVNKWRCMFLSNVQTHLCISTYMTLVFKTACHFKGACLNQMGVLLKGVIRVNPSWKHIWVIFHLKREGKHRFAWWHFCDIFTPPYAFSHVYSYFYNLDYLLWRLLQKYRHFEWLIITVNITVMSISGKNVFVMKMSPWISIMDLKGFLLTMQNVLCISFFSFFYFVSLFLLMLFNKREKNNTKTLLIEAFFQ